MVMTGTLEAAKLIAAAWLARHWNDAPLVLRSSLVIAVIMMMLLSAVGSAGFLIRAHLDHLTQEREAIAAAVSPIAEQIKIAEINLHDLDGQVARLDQIITAATARGYAKTAMGLVGEQERRRGDLVGQRDGAAHRLADLRVELAGVEARRARVAGEAGPAGYIANVLGWSDGEVAVRLVTLLLVMVIDPTAILLTLAASYRRAS
jgi:hypothetical protein